MNKIAFWLKLVDLLLFVVILVAIGPLWGALPHPNVEFTLLVNILASAIFFLTNIRLTESIILSSVVLAVDALFFLTLWEVL